MRSDDDVAVPDERGRGLAYWLRSQELGVACGFATVVLLAIGSFVLPATADGASKGIALDDLRPFFERPSPVHAWLYALAAVLAVYGLNTALATWASVTRKWRAGVRSPGAYAPALFHVSFLVALAAHGVGGVWGRDDGRVLVGPDPVALPGFPYTARTLSLDVDTLPSGLPRSARAELELREPSGAARRVTVGYNEPASAGLGTDLLLLENQGTMPSARGPVPVVALRVRHAPGDPIALVAAVIMAAGVLLLGRRLA
jgi:hypothetical protein